MSKTLFGSFKRSYRILKASTVGSATVYEVFSCEDILAKRKSEGLVWVRKFGTRRADLLTSPEDEPAAPIGLAPTGLKDSGGVMPTGSVGLAPTEGVGLTPIQLVRQQANSKTQTSTALAIVIRSIQEELGVADDSAAKCKSPQDALSCPLLMRLGIDEPMYRLYQALGIVFAFGFTCWTFSCYLAHFNNYHRDLLSDAVYYRAERPFVQRTLLPTTVNLLARLVPKAAKQEAVRFVHRNPAMQRIFTVDRNPYAASGSLKLEKDYPVETVIALALIFACLLGFVRAILLLYDECYTGSFAFRAAVPSIAAAGVVPWLSYTSHFYDFVSLLLFASSLLLLRQEKWRAYLIVFALACLNKETAILNSFVFVVYLSAQRRLNTSFVRRYLALQIALYVVIQSAIVYAFRRNGGGPTEFHFFDLNLPILREWVRYHYNLEQLVTAILILTAIFYRWEVKPLVLRCGLVIAIPLFCLGVFLGVMNEWRAFTDLYTPMLLLVLGSLGGLFGVRPLAELEQSRVREVLSIE